MIFRTLHATLFCIAASSATIADDNDLRARNDAIIVRAIERMEGYDHSNDQHVSDAIERHIASKEGTAEYLQLVKRFRPEGLSESLEAMLLSGVDDSVKVEAAGLLGDAKDGPLVLRRLLRSENAEHATSIARILGLLGNGRSTKMLLEIASDAERPFDVRKNAVVGLARNNNGSKSLLQLAKSKQLAPDTRLLAGGLLARNRDADIRKQAAEILPQPQQKDHKPLAPIDQLSAMRGDASKGMALFRGVATCANCHVVGKHGKEVGPNLSEIGSKLSREAMFTSILDPSAGISHNYENFMVLTTSGQVINGLMVSETPDAVTIRTAEAIDRKIAQGDIEQMKKSEKSIMPDNLHQTVDQKGLIDLVEYMTELKKKPL
ncbi:MAG: hypothetical protein ACR2NZ_09675 [Rubripirellula sp.]